MATCGICHDDDLAEIGELDSCPHRFCFPCIKQWSEIENRCPFCKARFGVICRKQLEAASPRSSPRSLYQLSGTIVEVPPHPHPLIPHACTHANMHSPARCCVLHWIQSIHTVSTRKPLIFNPDISHNHCKQDSCLQYVDTSPNPSRTMPCAPQTFKVHDRDQRPDAGFNEGEGADPMAEVVCLECEQGDDDEHLLLCDGTPLKPCTFWVRLTLTQSNCAFLV